MGKNFPGVGYQKHIKSWKSICPDPDFIFLEDTQQQTQMRLKKNNY